MKKYLVSVNIIFKNDTIITAICLEFEEISITNISFLKEECLNHYDISLSNPLDITILGWSEFAD